MTNLVIPYVLSLSNVAMSNVIVATNADGTVTMTQTGMRMVLIGPGALVIAFLVVAMITVFLWKTFSKGQSVDSQR